MPNQYSEQERIETLALLQYNRYNVALTSKQTGVPERALREWRRIQRDENCLPPLRQIVDIAKQFDSPSAALKHVYSTFVGELVSIADSLPDMLSTAPPYQQLQTMMKILDRLELLKVLMSDTPIEQVIRIEYVDPDGSVHKVPFWQREPSDEDDAA